MQLCDNRDRLQASSTGPKPELGILFVHGIGEQLQGETLVHFADPLSRWLTRWLTKGGRTEAAVGSQDGTHVVITDTELEPSGPAHCLMTIEAPDHEPFGGKRRWLLAESWWAETFRPPKTTALLLWLLLVLPYMALVQLYAQFRHSLRTRSGFKSEIARVVRVVAYGFIYICALPLAAVVGVVIVALLVALVVPIPQVSERAKKAALLLANTLGDCFVLVHSSAQFDAMVSRVVDDLAWLAPQVERVAVVAHSQGAAVSHHALAVYDRPRNLELFVTVGQGLNKLELVRNLQTYGDPPPTMPRISGSLRPVVSDPLARIGRAAGALWKTVKRWLSLKTSRFTIGWIGLAGFYLLTFSVPQLVATIGRPHTHPGVLPILAGIGGGMAIVTLVSCYLFWRADISTEPKPLRRPDGTDLRWADFYASADPVSNGPLFKHTAGDWLVEKEVWNRASFLRDHTTYTLSEDDFLGCLASELFKTVEKQPDEKQPDPGTQEVLERARWRGWWRVWWLSFARSLAALAAVVTVVRVAPNLKKLGGRVTDWGWWSPLRSVGHALLKALDGVIVVGNPSHPLLVGLVTVVAVIVSGYVLLALMWSFWERQDVKRFYRREPPSAAPDPLGGREFLWFLFTLCLFSAFAVVVGWTRDYATPWSWLRDHPVWVSSGLALPAIAPFFLTWALRRLLRRLEERLMKAFPRDVEDAEPPPEAAPARKSV
jgi:hypothetical protein